MPIRGHEHMSWLIEDYLAVLCHSRPHPLLEEEDVLAVKTEPAVLLEARDRSLVVRLGRHHIERNGLAVLKRLGQHLAGMEMEKRLVCYRTDRIRTLRAFISQPRSLTAGDKKHTHASGRKLLGTCRHGRSVRLALQLGDLRRCRCGDTLCRLFFRLAADESRKHRPAPCKLREVDRGNLRKQRLARLYAKLPPKIEDMTLSVGLKNLFRFRIVHCLKPFL